jgi:hypothetical protein
MICGVNFRWLGVRRLMVAVGLVALLGAVPAGCARKQGTASGPQGSGGLGTGPGDTPSSGAPDGIGGLGTGPGASLSATPAAPRLLASKAGYVWGNDPVAASYSPEASYRYNSSGGSIGVTRLGPGDYRVTFAGIGDPGGIAHATAYGNTSNFCAVVRWTQRSADEDVEVKCWDRGAGETDTMFVANFAVGSQRGAAFSYLYADAGSRTGRYTPTDQYRYDTTGQPSWVERIGAGHYRVYLPASRDVAGQPYTFQVSTVGPVTLRCKVSAVSAAPGTHEVLCHDALGTPHDSRFTLSFSAQGSFIGRTDQRYGQYTQSSPGTANPSVGVYMVTAGGLGADRGQVVAYARGSSTAYCHVGYWNATGADLSLQVLCFSQNGSPAAGQFMVGVTW